MKNPLNELKQEQIELAEQIKKEHDHYDSYVFRHKHKRSSIYSRILDLFIAFISSYAIIHS